MVDISMAGTKVVINFVKGGQITVDQFSDEGTPIDIPATQIADGNKNMNGVLVSWTKPSVSTVSFTLIPGGEDDLNLRAKLRAQSLSGTHTPDNAFISTLVIHTKVPNADGTTTTGKGTKTYTFYNGRMQTGQPAIGANSDGKGSPSTYAFMFEGID